MTQYWSLNPAEVQTAFKFLSQDTSCHLHLVSPVVAYCVLSFLRFSLFFIPCHFWIVPVILYNVFHSGCILCCSMSRLRACVFGGNPTEAVSCRLQCVAAVMARRRVPGDVSSSGSVSLSAVRSSFPLWRVSCLEEILWVCVQTMYLPRLSSTSSSTGESWPAFFSLRFLWSSGFNFTEGGGGFFSMFTFSHF